MRLARLRPLLVALLLLAGCEAAGPVPTAAPAIAPVPAPAAAASPPPTTPPPVRAFATAVEAGWQAVAETPVSTFSVAGDTASYTLARRLLEAGQLPQPGMLRPEEFLNAFDYDYPRPPSARQPLASFVSVHPSPWAPDRRLVQIGLRAYAPDMPAERPRLNLVVLVDVSGSMEPEDRLPLLRQGLAMLLPQLRADDRVSLVTYSDEVRVVLDAVPGSEQPRIAAALAALRAGGATAGGPALAVAYRLAARHLDRGAVNRVILATDGDFNIGIRSPAALKEFVEERRREGIYLTTVGVGLDNYQDRSLYTLARWGNGTAIYAGSLQDLRRGLVEDFAANILPAADDVKAQVEFNPALVSHYRLIGYETRLLRREDFRNDAVDAGEIGTGRSVTALYEIVPVGAARPPAEPLRYAAPAARPPAPPEAELGFLRIAYKLPGEAQSRELARPILAREAHATLAAAPADARFAAAVAGFAQLLRQSDHVRGWGFAEAAALAQGARGEDPDGRRAEFVSLARLAAARWPRVGR